MCVFNPYWFKHITLNDKQRKELEAYDREHQKPKKDFSYLNNETTSVEPFSDVKDVTPIIEEEYVFDNDAMVF